MDRAVGPIQPLGDDELEAGLSMQIDAAVGNLGDELSNRRAEHLSVYLRRGYTDDRIAFEEDRSTTVDSSCADAVESILGDLVEMLMGAETIASFTPQGEHDEEAAAQETQAVDNIFFTQNQGYLILHNWLMDGLINENGYVKAWWDERDVVETVTYTGQTEQSIEIMIANFEADGATVELLDKTIEETRTIVSFEQVEQSLELQQELEEATEVIPDEGKQQLTIVSQKTSYTLKIRQTKGSYRIEAIPPDEVLVPTRWKNVTLKGVPFVGHRYLTTESDLIARGFDREQVMSLPTSVELELGAERSERFNNDQAIEADPVDRSAREVLVVECWTYADRDGDGISELIMATVSGADGKLLLKENGEAAVEEAQEIPIHCWSPFIVPHRHQGESIVGRTAPIQRTKTVLQRQMSDGVSFSGNPRLVLGKDAIGPDTIDDSMVYRPGGLIRAKDAAQVVPMKLPSSVPEIMPVLDYWSDRQEERTGATRLNQGIVADKFGKQVAGVTIAQLRQAGMVKVNMIARNFLETGFSSLMVHLHALMRRHQDRELAFQVRGKWVRVDPSAWGERSDVKAGIGIGTEGRMVKGEILREIIGYQKEALLNDSKLSDEGKMFNAMSDFVQVTGFPNPERYFTDPATVPPEPEQEEAPDPQTMLLEAQIKIAQTEADTKMRALQQKEINDTREATLKARELELKGLEIELRDDRDRDLAALKASLEADKLDIERSIEILRSQISAPDDVKSPTVDASA